MLYDLIQKLKGKEIVVMTDIKAIIDSRKRKLQTSQKGYIGGNRVEYSIRESTSKQRYKKKQNKMATSGGDPRFSRPAIIR